MTTLMIKTEQEGILTFQENGDGNEVFIEYLLPYITAIASSCAFFIWNLDKGSAFLANPYGLSPVEII